MYLYNTSHGWRAEGSQLLEFPSVADNFHLEVGVRGRELAVASLGEQSYNVELYRDFLGSCVLRPHDLYYHRIKCKLKASPLGSIAEPISSLVSLPIGVTAG